MNLKKTFGTLALALLAGLSGCASTPAPTNLAETLQAQPRLSTFNRLVAQAGLSDSLRAAGPLTVFAPSDEAFKALPAKTLEELAKNNEQLKAVLNFHLIAAKLPSAEIQNGNLKTLNGASVALSRAGTFVTIEDAVVQQADIGATNGVAHVIDRVLTPPKK